jgi:hypothetical protein
MCKISYKIVKNESYKILMNICKLNLAYLQVLFNKFAQNECEKCVLPNNVDKKLQICKMSKLHIFVSTNIYVAKYL